MKSLKAAARSRRQSLWIGILLVTGCGTRNAPTTFPNVTSAQQERAAQVMRLKFPVGTRFVTYYYESGGMDESAYLRIELPPAALDEFLRQSPLAQASWEQDFHPMANFSWLPGWQPQTATKFRYQQFQLPSAEAINVLIDDSSQKFKIVYLQWIER